MVPVMAVVFHRHGALYALGVYALASLTDVLDGYIARRFNQISDVGKLLDPLADKLMVVTMLVMLVIKGYLPMWVPIAVGLKELIMVLGAALLLKGKDVVVMANKFGKTATAAFFAGIVLLCLSDLWAPLLIAGRVICYIAVALSVVAMISYARAYLIEGRNDRTQ